MGECALRTSRVLYTDILRVQDSGRKYIVEKISRVFWKGTGRASWTRRKLVCETEFGLRRCIFVSRATVDECESKRDASLLEQSSISPYKDFLFDKSLAPLYVRVVHGEIHATSHCATPRK